jgi:N-acetylmuramoyl-L-alanine amidase
MRPFGHGVIGSFLAGVAMAVALVSGCAWAAPAPGPHDVSLMGIRFGGDAGVTRVVLDLDSAISGKLVADESAAGRLVIALPALLSAGPLQGPGKGVVTGWSVHDEGGGARLVLETSPGATIVRRFALPPVEEGGRWRYVIDIRGAVDDALAALLQPGAPRLASTTPPQPAPTPTPSAPSAPKLAIQAAPAPPPPVAASTTGAASRPPVAAPRYAETAPWQPVTAVSMTPVSLPASRPPTASPAARPAVIPFRAVAPSRPAVEHAVERPMVAERGGAERGVKVIVIDAGHGGHDTGAQSLVRNEKDITLAAALSLRAHLLKMGRYRVVMTRDSDVFIPLEGRVQIARRAGADLFISLHADSAGSDPTPHGASVYTLSDSGETRVNYVLGPHEWFAHAGDVRTTADVRQILLDLTQRSTRNRSSEFAAKLLGHIGDKVDLLPRSHRDAGYFVLLAPDVPAVLLEMGFITNPGDQMRLTDPAQREKLTAGIADAIDDYFYGATRLTAGF